MVSTFVLSQIVAGIAFLSDIASFQFKKREITLAFFVLSASLLAVHFYLLGATTAAVIFAISAVRFTIAAFSTNPLWKYFFLALIPIAGYVTYDGFEDILVVITMIFTTLAAFEKDEKRLREFMAIGISIIIIHNIIIFTPVGIFIEVFFLGSNLLSYWRFYLKKKET